MQKRGRAIVLIGFMGAGKSTVGRLLAERMKLPLFETDEMIAAGLGLKIPEIFERHGEEFFRDWETHALRQIARQPSIVVTGGGIILREENVERCRELGMLVWLDANEEAVRQRTGSGDGRPLLLNRDPRELLRHRMPLYEAAADLRIDASQAKPEEIVREILHRIPADQW